MPTMGFPAGTVEILTIDAESCDADLDGRCGPGEAQIQWDYVQDGQVVAVPDNLTPTLSTDGSCLRFLERAHGGCRARKLRLGVRCPAHVRVVWRIVSGTITHHDAGECEVSMASGTVSARRNGGGLAISIESGSLDVSLPAPRHRHELIIGSGTVRMQAGQLLPYVTASVDQGVITGEHLGRLERVGAGWRLWPVTQRAGAIQCRLGSGTILLGRHLQEPRHESAKTELQGGAAYWEGQDDGEK